MMGECLVAPSSARLANAIGPCPIRHLGDGEGGGGEREGWMEERDREGVRTVLRMEGWAAEGGGLINSLLCFSDSHFCPPHPHIPAGPSRHGKSSSTTSSSSHPLLSFHLPFPQLLENLKLLCLLKFQNYCYPPSLLLVPLPELKER